MIYCLPPLLEEFYSFVPILMKFQYIRWRWRRKFTFRKVSVKIHGFLERIALRGIVQFCVADYEAEVLLERREVLIQPLVEFRLHRAKVHGILDDLQIATRPGFSINREHGNFILTQVHGLSQDRRVA